VVREHGSLRDGLRRSQILCRALAATSVRDGIERDFLPLVDGAHAGAFDRADMNEDIIAAGLRLNEAEALLIVKPSRNTRMH